MAREILSPIRQEPIIQSFVTGASELAFIPLESIREMPAKPTAEQREQEILEVAQLLVAMNRTDIDVNSIAPIPGRLRKGLEFIPGKKSKR